MGFYEELVDAWNAKGLDYPKSCNDQRRWIKRRFLVDVLNFHPSDAPRPMARLVEDRWPSVIRFAGMANSLGRGTLIASLQRVESWLMIEQVAPRLIEKDIPILTLHDAILSRERDEEAVRDTFYDVCEEIGFTLKLKDRTPCVAMT